MDAINTVQFSCHTGHKVVAGQVLNASDLKTVFDGLVKNEVISGYTHILTGYNGSLSCLQHNYQVIEEVKRVNPQAIYVCDPVLGDAGKMYVPPELLPFYRDHLISLADILTPNDFEAELLTGIVVESQETAFQAMDALHNKGIKIVVISSSRLNDWKDRKEITCFASQVCADGSKNRVRVQIPQIDATFVGTGDLTTALLLAWFYRTNNDLALSCSKVMSTVKAVLDRTIRFAENSGEGFNVRTLELKLVQSKRDIEDPPDLIHANTVL